RIAARPAWYRERRTIAAIRSVASCPSTSAKVVRTPSMYDGACTTTPTIGTLSSEKRNGASSIPRKRDFAFMSHQREMAGDLDRELPAGQVEVRAHRDHEFVVHLPAPSVQFCGPLLFELLQLRLDGPKLRTGLVPERLVVGLCVRRLQPHPPFGVFNRPPQRLAPLRELLELEAHPMVPLLFRQELSRSRLRDARERRMDAGHPGVCAAPPSDDEERRRQTDQPARDVRAHDVAEARRLVDPERV